MGTAKTVKKVRALNLATNTVMMYASTYRFAKNPKRMFAPPYLTDSSAFSMHDVKYLIEAKPDDEVFIEWSCDRFCSHDQETGDLVPGSTVWRLSRIIDVIDVPKLGG